MESFKCTPMTFDAYINGLKRTIPRPRRFVNREENLNSATLRHNGHVQQSNTDCQSQLDQDFKDSVPESEIASIIEVQLQAVGSVEDQGVTARITEHNDCRNRPCTYGLNSIASKKTTTRKIIKTIRKKRCLPVTELNLVESLDDFRGHDPDFSDDLSNRDIDTIEDYQPEENAPRTKTSEVGETEQVTSVTALQKLFRKCGRSQLKMNVRKRSKLRPVELDGFVGSELRITRPPPTRKYLLDAGPWSYAPLRLEPGGPPLYDGIKTETFASEVIFESSNRPNRNISYERLDTRNPRFKIPDEAYRQLSQIKTPVKAYSERESDESETTEETQTSEDSEDIDDGADSDLSEEECSTSGEELPATTPLTGQDDVFRGISATKHLQRADWILHEHTLSSVGHVGRPYSNPGQAHLMRAGGAWIEVPEEIYGE